MTTQYPFVRELYDAFQQGEFERWDALVAENVLVNSTMGRDIQGREALKGWAAQFVNALQSQVDLVDEFEAIDAAGNGRAFFTVCLDWKHAEVFMGLQPLLTETGANAQAATLADAATQAEVLVLTVTWDAMPEVVKSIGNLDGKILLDCTNPLVGNQLDTALNLAQSGGEQVAAWFPGAKVVKIFNQVGWETMATPHYGTEAATMFYAGDDANAKQIASQLANELGFESIDAGTLQAAKFLETLAIFWGQLAYGQGLGRNIAWRLLK
jgi:8-hydroxy-5-deazaflavin:NADPH oxidoreductase